MPSSINYNSFTGSIIDNLSQGSTLMVWGEDLATVFTIHNLSTVVEPLDTFSKLFSPIFTVDIKSRKVIFRIYLVITNWDFLDKLDYQQYFKFVQRCANLN